MVRSGDLQFARTTEKVIRSGDGGREHRTLSFTFVGLLESAGNRGSRKTAASRVVSLGVLMACFLCVGPAASASAALKADYRFDGTLTSGAGTAPALTQVGG